MKAIHSIITVALTALSLTTARASGNGAGVDRFGPSLAGVYGRIVGFGRLGTRL